jgi:CRP-like cAMP-binding protein
MQNIYELMDVADSAYILHSGKLVFEITPTDRYHLEGKEIIFGAEEPLIALKLNREDYFRFQSVYLEGEAVFDRIPLQNLYKVISVYNIGYSIAKNIAKFVQITNRMFINKEQRLSGKEMASREYALLYAEIVDGLKKQYGKLKTSWLKELTERFSDSLVYTKGVAFRRETPKSELKLDTAQLDEFTVDLSAGSLLCEEGDIGNEMFILNRGNLDVYIRGKKVAQIHESGTVIGEMALLLGETRTATIKAVTDSNVTMIKPENLKEIAQNNQDFFLNVAVNMARRLEHNCGMIRETDELLAELESAEPNAPPKERTNYKELMSFVAELERYESRYRFPWMSQILKNTRAEMSKIRGSHP